ncbi:hypothetical protein Lfu02_75680 [Longispora fulva]|uniref:Uncharacterized protein n=1 Tax=Longispora fulva TaxID=619741 RepID=A0A8J7KK60_9ACTN|nr:hypothetical protein [Longispora fulva]MBG6136296.1 hypothetical protein [Longispora fulva]GIG63196.1 hypothetical protein Lfu02_75680 [Longispora fulva]
MTTLPDPLAAIISRFPRVPRMRPAARPLDARAARLLALAHAARDEQDPTKASQAINGATLLASDCQAHGLARDWCRIHALVYLDQTPLDRHAAYFVLEPLVNLARLRIRAGDGRGAHHILTSLHEAYTRPEPVNVEGIHFQPEALMHDAEVAGKLRDWVRDVLLTDGTRALISIGAWRGAVSHIQRLNGLRPDLTDSRQVAVIAAIRDGHHDEAAALLETAETTEPWQQAAAALLTAMNTPGADHRHLLDLPTTVNFPEPSHTLYRTRLALTAIDLADQPPYNRSRDLLDQTVADVIAAADGTSARMLLTHPGPSAPQREHLTAVVHTSGLHLQQLPADLHATVLTTLATAADVIRHRDREPAGRPDSPGTP